MSYLLSEPRISLTDLAKRERVHVSTCWRWCLRGCQGHVLESFSVGGRKFTTLPAFERWLLKINATQPPLGPSPEQRRREWEKADLELDSILEVRQGQQR